MFLETFVPNIFRYLPNDTIQPVLDRIMKHKTTVQTYLYLRINQENINKVLPFVDLNRHS